ncbi:putative c6 zinc finger domain protein [Phaeomoniella chlamydospora]|uniref:Putative c6 zinc finger domain protein n=1 Tax=Phaeomoniella chlamydospora TaxID=158046 RepID=A0A0G2DY96_PHACM|nr:putative c6 zinc finger domain protein [Phaeomoniella chlamydospora]
MSLTPEAASNKRPKSRSDNAYPRKRALQACQTCRARRTKCDNGRPSCSACLHLGAECIYREKDNSTLDQGTLTILERLDGLEALLLSPARLHGEPSPLASNFVRPHIDRQNHVSPVNFSSPVQLDESDSFPHSITVEGVLSWPLWSGQWDGELNIKQLLLSNPFGNPPPAGKETKPEDTIMGEERLINNYFKAFNIFNPVLDERKISQYRQEVQLNGYGWDAQSCLLLLVFAIGNIAELEEYWADRGNSYAWREELRLELHLSESALRDFKYPSFFPSPPKDLKPEGEAAWYFYLAEIALQRLRGRILYNAYKCQITGLTVHDMIDMVLNFEQQAREWMSSLPAVLALDREPLIDHSGHEAEHESLRLILRSHLLDCFEVMYWPFIKEILNHDFHAGPAMLQQPTPTVLSFAQKGLDVCIDRIEQTETGFRSRHHGTWLTLRSCARSAFVLMAARERFAGSPEFKNYLRLPSSLVVCVNKVMDLLRFWQQEVPDAYNRLQMLQNLMTNDLSIT